MLRRPPFRELVDALDRHLESITDIYNLLSPVLGMCGKSDGYGRFCFTVDLSQIAALVWNHFRYENLHWESIGRRWLMPDLIPGSENKKI